MEDDDLITNWGLVLEAYTAVNDLMEADIDRTTGLPLAWFSVLLRLYRTPGHQLPMTQLARVVNFTSGGFTKLADRMEEAGYVKREPSALDRRVTNMSLTKSGERIIADGLSLHVDFLRHTVLRVLGAERFAELGAIMRVLRDAYSPDYRDDASTPRTTSA